MHHSTRSRTRRAAVALTAAAALVLPLSAAHAAPGDAPVTEITDELTAVPAVEGPIQDTSTSYMYSTMLRAREAFDVADFGFVEEEYFLSGTANVYEETGTPGVATVAEESWDYTNNIIVRRPADPADASGVVVVDILNASNGYPGEDHWRRMYDWCLDTGCTYIGLTSKPIQIDSLHHFDAERYGALSWDVPGAEPRVPYTADVDAPASFDPMMEIPGTEEGLAWDIFTQLGNLLNENPSAIIGDVTPTATILAGQSQSGVYLNTYTTYFDAAAARANGAPVWDAYLNSVGGTVVRPLRQVAGGGLVSLPNTELELSVPMITVDSETDFVLFGETGLDEQPAQPLRRHWQIPGAPHTWSASPVIPTNEELVKAGRLPRAEVTPEWLATQNPYPLEPAIVSAIEALAAWVVDGTPAPESGYFEQADDALVRDELGNVVGGVRYGLNRLPLASIDATDPPNMQGTVTVISRDAFAQAYGSRSAYLEQLGAALDEDIANGYLNAAGKALFLERAGWLLDRIEAGEGDPAGPGSGDIPVVGVIPGMGEGPGALTMSVAPGSVTLGEAIDNGDRWTLNGALPTVSVTDTRAEALGWTASGQAAALTSGANAVTPDHLGWTPMVAEAPEGVSAGPVRVGVLKGGAGLAVPATLAQASGLGRIGTSELGADVELQVARTTAAGTYTGSVTVSVFPMD